MQRGQQVVEPGAFASVGSAYPVPVYRSEWVLDGDAPRLESHGSCVLFKKGGGSLASNRWSRTLLGFSGWGGTQNAHVAGCPCRRAYLFCLGPTFSQSTWQTYLDGELHLLWSPTTETTRIFTRSWAFAPSAAGDDSHFL